MQLTGSKDGGWEYTDSAGESKMEISVDTVATVADRFAVDRDSRRSRRLSRC